jgi:hypothetical protein
MDHSGCHHGLRQRGIFPDQDFVSKKALRTFGTIASRPALQQYYLRTVASSGRFDCHRGFRQRGNLLGWVLLSKKTLRTCDTIARNFEPQGCHPRI